MRSPVTAETERKARRPPDGTPAAVRGGRHIKETGLVDLLIVGGGINGAGIARDAAGRGLTVLLCEKGDLAGATSSASTKLIHGGLRYLEYYQFRLVREALAEREVLLASAPHIIWPMRFVLPHDGTLRPAWLIRLGLFLYDHIGGRKRLPGSSGIDLRHHVAGAALIPTLRKGFVYSDCWVEDSRLVVLNCMAAAENGAHILPRTECVTADRTDEFWSVVLRDHMTGTDRKVRARALVNATGPWVAAFQRKQLGATTPGRVRLVKGSHIVVPRLFEHPFAYILQNADRRIVFAIPYEGAFTLIGTTDVAIDEGELDDVRITADEIAYLCDAVNRNFRSKIDVDAIVWSYAGVRPLHDDDAANASAVSRDYVLDLDAGDGRPPLLNVIGGKITIYRRLAEQAMAKLAPTLGIDDRAWTVGAPLPGGDIADADFETFAHRFATDHPFLPPELSRRYARAYGTRAQAIVGGAHSLQDLGEPLGDGVYAAELEYLATKEWACTADDVLWRRSRLGLHVARATAMRIEAWMAARRSPPAEVAIR